MVEECGERGRDRDRGGGGSGRLSDDQIGRQADIHRGADDGVKKKTQMK